MTAENLLEQMPGSLRVDIQFGRSTTEPLPRPAHDVFDRARGVISFTPPCRDSGAIGVNIAHIELLASDAHDLSLLNSKRNVRCVYEGSNIEQEDFVASISCAGRTNEDGGILQLILTVDSDVIVS